MGRQELPDQPAPAYSGVGSEGSGAVAMGGEVPHCHSGTYRWRVLGFHLAQEKASKLFKKGESRFQTLWELGCPALVGFVIP